MATPRKRVNASDEPEFVKQQKIEDEKSPNDDYEEDDFPHTSNVGVLISLISQTQVTVDRQFNSISAIQ